MKIALAQINSTVGDLDGNAAVIRDYYARAQAQGADLVVYPELALIGYPPEDLMLMPDFRRRAMLALQSLAEMTMDGPAVIVGCVIQEEEHVFNAACFLEQGRILHIQPKTMLPNYGVFDEKRIFTPGHGAEIVEWQGVRLGLLVCEDMWFPGLAEKLKTQGVQLVIVINASPFEAGKLARRHQAAAEAARAAHAPLIYANAVGGQDDIVFDGGSFAVDADGSVVWQMKEFAEDLVLIPSPVGGGLGWGYPCSDRVGGAPLPASPLMGEEQAVWRAMSLGLADYMRKNGFPGVVLGLSGGIDSAISAALAVDALGADKVKGILLPSPYTSKESVEDALETARLLGIETMTIPITAGMEVFDEVLSPVFKDAEWMEDPAVGGNVQARLRGVTLMALSNKYGWLLLSTGNKSEVAVGYTTLYGDACGGYNVLKDVYKTQVYALARWRKQQSPAIPERSIDKAPSAELKPGQTDQDQLPPYDLLDAILLRHLEGRMSAEEIIAEGYDRATVEKVIAMVRRSEYKRRQSCPGVKLSPMLFGRDRRFPLTNKF